MFSDRRSKKVMFVAHCVLNQNAKLDRCAHYPGMVQEITAILLEQGIGVIQLPCPELLTLGLDRQADRNRYSTVESEDSRIAARMAEVGKITCAQIAQQVSFQVQEYRKNGFEVLGLVGINGSPTCGVETTWSADEEREGPGVLIRAIGQELEQALISIEMRGVKVYQLQQAEHTLEDLLNLPVSDGRE